MTRTTSTIPDTAESGGMSNRAIALALGISPSTVSRVLDRATRPTGHTLGLDGKHYQRYDRGERQWLKATAQQLAVEGLSIRQVQAAFAAEGWKVSVGTIHAWTVQVRQMNHLNTADSIEVAA